MNYNNQNKSNSGNARNIIGFTLFGSAVIFLFGVLPTQLNFEQQEKEEDVKNKIARFVATQPNYLDSLRNFDSKNSKNMMEWDNLIERAVLANKPVPSLEQTMLSNKIDERNDLVVKKEEVNRLIRNYADSIQKINDTNLNIASFQR